MHTHTWCIYFFIHSSVDGHLGCFHVLAIVNNAAVNKEVHVSFWISACGFFFGYISRSGIVESYGFIFIFLRNFHTVVHSGCINLHSHQQYTKILFSPYPHQHLLFVDFLMIDILTVTVWRVTFDWEMLMKRNGDLSIKYIFGEPVKN